MRFTSVVAISLASAMAVNAGMIYQCTQPNTIALTFDDGPYEYTNELLDHLKSANIHATFFINGDNWWGDLSESSSKKAVLARAAAEGHQIASHTWEHEISSSREKLRESLAKVENLIESSTGKRPTYFRAPQGECDSSCIAYIESLGYRIIQWDTDTNDWDYKFGGVEDRKKRVGLVKNFLTEEWGKNKSNYLVLMHDVQIHTVREIIPWVVKNAPFNKYKFVTVAECLGDKTKGMVGKGKAQTITPTKSVDNVKDKSEPVSTPAKVNTTPNNSSNTGAPVANSSTSNAPVTNSSTTNAPVTNSSTSNAPVTNSSTSNAPVTNSSTSNAPVTNSYDANANANANANTNANTNAPYTNPTYTNPQVGADQNGPVLSNIIPGNATAQSNLSNNNQASGAISTTSNLYLVAALLVYSLYMAL